MSIPNPYPNIADKEINDVKTWSSAKIINELQPALDTEIHCENTYEGNIVTFNNLNNKEITSLACEILPIQEGTGTPSPSNPRPISGTSVLDIKHSGADTSDYDTTSVALGQTVYGGTADVVGGVGTITYGSVDLGTLEWTYHTASGQYSDFFDCYLPNDSIVGTASVAFDGYFEIYKSIPSANIALSGYNNGVMALATSTRRFIVCDQRYTSAEALKTALNGKMLVYPLATPTTFTFTGQPINSLLGVNNVWTDSGNIKVTTVETGTIGNILKERGILP